MCENDRGSTTKTSSITAPVKIPNMNKSTTRFGPAGLFITRSANITQLFGQSAFLALETSQRKNAGKKGNALGA